MSLTFWYWASVQAAYEYRSRVLGASMPKNAPTFGDRVLIRDIQGEGTSFDASAKEGVFLALVHDGDKWSSGRDHDGRKE